MRRNYLVITTISCVFFLLAGCQQQAEKPAAAEVVDQKAEPKIEFESLVYDFGQIIPGVKKVGEFKFTNTGDGLLRITKVDRCCGIVTRLDKTEYAPGEIGLLKVEYRATRSRAVIKKKLYLNSNDKATPKVTLTIKADIVPKVVWEPRTLRLSLIEENAGCPEIMLKSTDNQPFSITRFTSTDDCITADIDSSVQATKFVLEAKADAQKLLTNMKGHINIGLAYSKPDAAPDTATILFNVLPRFSVRPSLLIVSYAKPQELIRKHLWLVGNYGEDLEIESTSSKEGHIKVLSQKKNRKGNSYVLTLEITPPAEDTGKFTDVLYINLKADETLEVLCQGIYSEKSVKPKASDGHLKTTEKTVGSSGTQ